MLLENSLFYQRDSTLTNNNMNKLTNLVIINWRLSKH